MKSILIDEMYLYMHVPEKQYIFNFSHIYQPANYLKD